MKDLAAQNVMGLQSVLYTYRLARDSDHGRGPHFNNYWGSLPSSDPNCLRMHERRCMDPVLGGEVAPPSGTAKNPFEFQLHRRDSLLFHGDVVMVSLDAGPTHSLASFEGMMKSLDELDAMNREGIAVGINYNFRGVYSENWGWLMHRYQVNS